MSALIRVALLAPLVLVVVLFALSNAEPVEVRLWPLDAALVTPLSVAVLAASAVAFLLGATVAWASALPARRRAARLAEAARLLGAELEALREAQRAEEPVGAPAPPRPAMARGATRALSLAGVALGPERGGGGGGGGPRGAARA